MEMLSDKFINVMPAWAKEKFFDPENERSRLRLHDYANSELEIFDAWTMSNCLRWENSPWKAYLVFKQPLRRVTKSNLKKYLQKYLLILPGDWLAQFYTWQAVYKSVYPYGKSYPPENLPSDQQSGDYNDYSVLMSARHFTTTTAWKKEMDSILLLIRTRHVSLDICELNHPPMKYIYERLFPGCLLACKPKPWGITLLLEIIYGWWTVIRSTVVTLFSKCKQQQYAILLNLLDNYLPLVLIIYGISFKLNQFGQYFKAAVRNWTMFYYFRRKHCDKAPLIWVSNIGHWSQHYPELFQ